MTKAWRTSLSPAVQDVILFSQQSIQSKLNIKENDSLFSSQDFLSLIDNRFPEISNGQTDEELFNLLIPIIKTLALEVHQTFSGKSLNEILNLYSKNYKWCNSKNLLIEMGISYHLKEMNFLAFLILVSTFDRSLGDIFATISSASQVPFLLRDLLLKPELEKLFGKKIVTFLRILIGPPTGLNLRNVLWHGFLVDPEFPPRYTSLLILTISCIGELLENQSIQVKERPLFDFSNFNFPEINHIIYDESFLGQLSPILFESEFIHPLRENSILLSFEFFQKKDYFQCLTLIFPNLEHCLRVLYSKANDMPEKVLTASPNVFYITLDIMLSQYTEDQKVNRIIQLIGTPAMELFYDLFIFPSGPRLRDKISHGEGNTLTLTNVVCKYVLILTAYLTLKFFKFNFDNVDAEESLQLQSFPLIWETTENYKSRFHPLSIFWQDVEKVFFKFRSFFKNLQQNPEIQNLDQENIYSKIEIQLILDEHQTILFQQRNLHLDQQQEIELINQFCNLQCHVLFRSSRTMKLVLLLSKIIEIISISLVELEDKMTQFSILFNEKKMRSQQRKNFTTLQTMIPSIIYGFLLTSLRIELIGLDLREKDSNENNKSEEEINEALILKKEPTFRKVKSILGAMERNLTNIRENQWGKISKEIDSTLNPL